MRDGHVATVSLDSTAVTDRELEILPELTQLEELNLRDTEISDVGAAHLSGLRTLRKLDVSYTLLSDSALDKLRPLANLRTLNLSNTLVEGPGLAALSGLSQLDRAQSGQLASQERGGRPYRQNGRTRATVPEIYGCDGSRIARSRRTEEADPPGSRGRRYWRSRLREPRRLRRAAESGSQLRTIQRRRAEGAGRYAKPQAPEPGTDSRHGRRSRVRSQASRSSKRSIWITPRWAMRVSRN